MIGRADVIPLLLAACTSFRERWSTVEAEKIDDEVGRLHYIDAAEFARHVVDLVKAQRTEELSEVFWVIEELHVEGDQYVRELATIGYLEGFQNVSSNRGVDPVYFEPYLGPEARRWWRGLNAFWQGEIPLVEPLDG